jgi:hypothetical protein
LKKLAGAYVNAERIKPAGGPWIPISEKSKHFEAATKPQKPPAVFSIAVFGHFLLAFLAKMPKNCPVTLSVQQFRLMKAVPEA